MIAYLNGRYVDAAELHISPVDSGFMLGITIAEQLRTLGGKVFQIDQHLDRMRGGLAEIDLADQINTAELPEIINRIVDENFKHAGRPKALGEDHPRRGRRAWQARRGGVVIRVALFE